MQFKGRDLKKYVVLSTNEKTRTSSVITFFSKKTPRIVHSTIHALGLVSASTTPWECTGWYKPEGMYCAIHTPEHLLRECTEHLVLAHSPIRRQAQARASVRMHSVKAHVMPYNIVILQNERNLELGSWVPNFLQL